MAKPTKYSGTVLSQDVVNAQQRTNDHHRSERLKDAQTNIEVAARYAAFACIPLIFVGLLVTDVLRKQYDTLVEHLTFIGSGLVGYLFGKRTGPNVE